MMVAFTLAAYAFVAWLFTEKWPWPISKIISPTTEHVNQKQKVDEEGNITFVEQPEKEAGLIIDDSEDQDQYTLEEKDRKYLSNNDLWRKDSIKSSKYKDIVAVIYNGNISEMKMKKINNEVIGNNYWAQIWRNIIVPNNIYKETAKKIFENLIKDHNTLDVKQLYEELEKNTIQSSDDMKSTGSATFPTTQNSPPTTDNSTQQVVN